MNFQQQTKPPKNAQKKLEIQMRPLLIPDLMGRIQIQATKQKYAHCQKSLDCKVVMKRFMVLMETSEQINLDSISLIHFTFLQIQKNKNLKNKVLVRESESLEYLQPNLGGKQHQFNFFNSNQMMHYQCLHQLQNESKSEIHSPQSQLYRQQQNTLSQINFDKFLKRPIQQFIKLRIFVYNKDINQHNGVIKLAKTEYSQKRFASMQHSIEYSKRHKHTKHMTDTSLFDNKIQTFLFIRKLMVIIIFSL
ncbi:unnamed protein product [Paramecium octaurelia]|uniref:Uncharacterized protein n=1 Tax=Paramecium octaurelia TaxID=43137 RepID=A0A8S1T157_PAROT|nr:unnamed protein product [Paramecium octaurelia]